MWVLSGGMFANSTSIVRGRGLRAPLRLRGLRVDAMAAAIPRGLLPLEPGLHFSDDEDDVPPLGVIDAPELGTFGTPAARRAASWPRRLRKMSEADRARVVIIKRNTVA